jgi:hypothetical protein
LLFGAGIALCWYRAEQATSNKTGAYNREQDIQACKVSKETPERQKARKEADAGDQDPSQDDCLSLSWSLSFDTPASSQSRGQHHGESIQTNQIGEEAGERQEARKEAAARRQDAAQSALSFCFLPAGFGPPLQFMRSERGQYFEAGKVGKEIGKWQETREQDHAIGEDAQERCFLKFDFPSWVLRPAGGLK